MMRYLLAFTHCRRRPPAVLATLILAVDLSAARPLREAGALCCPLQAPTCSHPPLPPSRRSPLSSSPLICQDSSFYLGLGKRNVTSSKMDLLGMAMLSHSDITWDLVAGAVPVIKGACPLSHVVMLPTPATRILTKRTCTGVGVRTFVGSRSSSVDTTFSDQGEDASHYGFPAAFSYVFNLTNIADGGTPLTSRDQYINQSAMAEGLVGGDLPIVVFYYPVLPKPKNSCLPAHVPANSSRYWTMVASPTPDMRGSREQQVWFRFEQVECAGLAMRPPCKMVGAPQYWDTYWWSRAPAGADTSATGPAQPANASGFYASLIANRRWWRNEFRSEGTMELELPSTKTSTNGTWLTIQARHNLILSMITKEDTWGPRYGVNPGYGYPMQNGFEDTFTATAMAALEWGAMPYAKGLIENEFSHYLRDDGLPKYRAIEVAQLCRMLTILALYHSYSDGDSRAFLLRHFAKAKALADWLIARRWSSLAEFSSDDPRYGLIAGLDEGDSFSHVRFHQGPFPPQYWYSHIAEAYRAFTEIGQVWAEVGEAAGRADVLAHAAELLSLAPKMYDDLHASLQKTANTTASPGHTCYPDNAAVFGGKPSYGGGCNFRAYPELFYSAALTAEQQDAMYVSGQGNTSCAVGRWLTDGSPSSGSRLIFTHIPQGLPFGLLVHDMVDRFLLYFFHQSAHANTRGTFTTPESTKLDRNAGGYAFASAGLGNVPMALKWMLCFEEPQTRTLWLAKATPRDWLEVGEAPIAASELTTRYGRVSFSLEASFDTIETYGKSTAAYTVHANVSLPSRFGDGTGTVPVGGIRLRLRAPLLYAGKLSHVTVGGKPWTAFNAAEETIDIARDQLLQAGVITRLQSIVAIFDGGPRA
jgi:hypothetical protein